MLLILITKKNSIRFSVAIKNRTEVFFFFFLSFFFLFFFSASTFFSPSEGQSFLGHLRRVENRIDAEKSKYGSNSYWYPVGADAHGRVLLCSRKRL